MDMEFKQMEVPKELDEVVEKSMKRIHEEQRRARRRSFVAKGCGIAAVLACGILVGVANPSAAADLPLIGHIFETMQEKFSYGGDYSGIGETLGETTESSEVPAEETNDGNVEKTYTQTVDGVTVTLSEIYCNKQAMYLSLEIHSDKAFPDMYEPELFTTEKYSFNPTKGSDVVALNGDLVDANTYAGLIRFDLNSKLIDTSEFDKIAEEKKEQDKEWMYSATDEIFLENINVLKLPDTFSLDLTIDEIRGGLKNPPQPDYGKTEEELKQMSDDEWQAFMKKWDSEHPGFWDSQDAIYKGPWNFSLDVSVNNKDTQVVDLTDRAENNIGFSAIIKDRFEITVYGLNQLPEDTGDYFPVLLDANGRLMDYGDGGSVCTVAINDSDVSTVEAFLIEDDLWLDNIKGEWWKTPEGLTDPEEIKAFRELLLENCAYHTEVYFE